MRIDARLTRQNQLTLPAAIRERLDIRGGDVVIFEITDETVRIVGREMRLDEIIGSIHLPEPPSSDFGIEIEQATAKAMEKYLDDSRLGVPGTPGWLDEEEMATVVADRGSTPSPRGS